MSSGHEENMIFPDIFDGHAMGFFTTKAMGSYIEEITGRKVYFPIQKHTDTVIELDPDLTPKEGDAVITDRANVILGVKVADCVPILIFDTRRFVIGAVHAGWRGTAKGILKKTISTLGARYRSRPEDLLLSIGPSIRQCCYEVDKDVADAVIHETGPGDYQIKKGDRFMLDLQRANMLQAMRLGVPESQIEAIEECTACHAEKYFSYRRDSKTSDRQGGFISLP